jgi:CcmD family protein
MKHWRVWALAAALALAAAPWAVAAQAQPPPAQQEFVPVDRLPQAEQMPAAPLVIGAYAFVWVALLGYVWSVRRRLNKVERELADVARRMAASGRKG